MTRGSVGHFYADGILGKRHFLVFILGSREDSKERNMTEGNILIEKPLNLRFRRIRLLLRY